MRNILSLVMRQPVASSQLEGKDTHIVSGSIVAHRDLYHLVRKSPSSVTAQGRGVRKPAEGRKLWRMVLQSLVVSIAKILRILHLFPCKRPV